MTVEANAKINLALEVRDRRPDGYHDLRSLVLPISLSDTIDVEPTSDGVIVSDTGYPDDLCVAAARTLRSFAPPFLSPRLGARISVVKRIPAGGGLGGGSADAAAILRALNALWELGLPPERLVEIGARVGSDVPALVLGGPVLMEGRGERVRSLASPDAPPAAVRPLHLVLVDPGVPSSTREVYAAYVPREPTNSSATDAMVAAFASGDPKAIAAALVNDLQAPAVALHPEIGEAISALRAAGTLGAQMSGSGSCAFGIATDEAEARLVRDRLVRRGFRASVHRGGVSV